jgi:predicted phosphodiesterase
LVDGSFEGVYGPTWTIVTETCAKADGTGTYDPRSGRLAWFGGDDDCEAAQSVDLIGRGFPAIELDNGDIGFRLMGWLRNGQDPGDFESRDWDDQVLLRLEALDSDSQILATWETLGAGDMVWIQREVQGLLPAGTRDLVVSVVGNWRAGEVHDSLADDLSLMLDRRVLSTPTVAKGPMLTEARTDGTTVLWETDAPWASSTLWWGTETPDTAQTVITTQVDQDRFVHTATLTGLAPETAVTYQLENGGLVSEPQSFRTLPEPGGHVRIGWFADNQLGPDQLAKHLALMGAEDPDLLVAVGDIVQEGWRLADWDELWFKPLDESGITQSTPVVVVRGNHDGEYPEAYAYTHLPGNQAWYSLTLGDLFLVVLDSEAPTDGTQLDFLVEALSSDEANDAAFSAVTFHRTAWSNTRDLAWGHHLDEARTDWEPVFEAYGVDLVICGHHHSYQRGTQNGVTYLVVGGAGNFLDQGHWDQFDWIEIEEIVNHHAILDVTPTRLNWTAYYEDGGVLDSFALSAE